ncbi:MAG: hypothetical protein V7L27_01730 [Nostoc sp.]|uniref:hypothetical protein n=1 Tax=Nostoc sp. TaxID=1180 RepID=UPI002FFA200F
MEIKLTTSEIRTILQGCQYTLRLVGSSKDYRRLQSSEYFSTAQICTSYGDCLALKYLMELSAEYFGLIGVE